MRIVVVTSNLPSSGHSVRAVTVLVRETLAQFREYGHDVALQAILPAGAAPTPDERAAIDAARAAGVTVLDPLFAPAAERGRRDLPRLLVSRDPAHFYPALALAPEFSRRSERFRADSVFNLWSRDGLGAAAEAACPVFTYYGNPDHKPLEARLTHPDLFEIPHRTPRQRLSRALGLAAVRRLRRANRTLMLRSRFVGNVTSLDADYWREQGHPDAFYLQNMWHRPPARPPFGAVRDRIVGSIGGLYATGNTFGMMFLGRELAPALERRLGCRAAIDIYGAGEPTDQVAAALARPSITRHGFVDDIDAEIATSKVFLLANNADPSFIGGHTRILHAWSLGSCLVAHSNISLAMPEVVHGENALLGADAEELAELIAEALDDDDLRARLAAGGRATFEREFTPEVVVARVLERLEHA